MRKHIGRQVRALMTDEGIRTRQEREQQRTAALVDEHMHTLTVADKARDICIARVREFRANAKELKAARFVAVHGNSTQRRLARSFLPYNERRTAIAAERRTNMQMRDAERSPAECEAGDPQG